MLSRHRLALFVVVAVIIAAAFALMGLSYGKFGSINPAWAQVYNLANGEGNGSFQLGSPFSGPVVPPPGGRFLRAARLHAWNVYQFDTMALLGVPCAQVVIYRVNSDGNELKHPDNASVQAMCSGNIITFNAVGDGIYLFFAIANPRTAPPVLAPNP